MENFVDTSALQDALNSVAPEQSEKIMEQFADVRKNLEADIAVSVMGMKIAESAELVKAREDLSELANQVVLQAMTGGNEGEYWVGELESALKKVEKLVKKKGADQGVETKEINAGAKFESDYAKAIKLLEAPDWSDRPARTLFDDFKRLQVVIGAAEDLTEDQQTRQTDVLNRLQWKVSSLELSDADKTTPYSSKAELLDAMKELESLGDVPEALVVLDGIVSSVLHLMGRDSKKLPASPKFYEKIMERMVGLGVSSERAFVALESLEAKAALAMNFRPGTLIVPNTERFLDDVWNETLGKFSIKNSVTSIVDLVDNTFGSDPETMIVESVDFYSQRVKIKGRERWMDMDYFNSNYFQILHLDQAGGMTAGMFDTPAAMSGKELSEMYDQTLAESQRDALAFMVADTKFEVSMVPSTSMFAQLLKSGEFKINDSGHLNVDDCKHLEEAAVAIQEQIKLQKLDSVRAALDANWSELEAADPFFEQKRLFLDAHISVQQGDEFLSRMRFVTFLNSLKDVDVKSSQELSQAKAEALAYLKGLSLRDLAQMRDMSVQLFSEEGSHYAQFRSEIVDLIAKEAKRIEDGEDYEINYSDLALDHWGTGQSTYNKGLGDRRLLYAASVEYATQKTGVVMPEESPEHTSIGVDRPVNIHRQRWQKAWIAAQQEYLEEHHPPRHTVLLWNQILRFHVADSKGDVFKSKDQRRKDLHALANAVNNGDKIAEPFYWDVDGRELPRRIEEDWEVHPEVAQVLYKDAMRDKMGAAELAMIDARKEYDRRESIFKHEKHVGEAKDMIEDLLDDSDFARELIVQGSITKEEYAALQGSTPAAKEFKSKLITKLAERFIDQTVSRKIEGRVLEQFRKEGFNGDVVMEKIFADFEGSLGLRDRIAFEKFLTTDLPIMIASMGAGSVLAAGFRGVMSGLKISSTISRLTSFLPSSLRTGFGMAYKGGTELVGFTGTSRALRDELLGEDLHTSFGEDMVDNGVLFAGIGAGLRVWKGLFESTVAKAFAKVPARLRPMKLKVADWVGGYATESALVTGFDYGKQLAEGVDPEDVSFGKLLLDNFLKVGAIRGGNWFASPVTKPLNERIAARDRMLSESLQHDPSGATFLKNKGLKADFFEAFLPKGKTASNKSAMAKAREAGMSEYYALRESTGVTEGAFAGKSGAEVRRIMERSTELLQRPKPPSTSELKDMLAKDPDVFMVISNRMEVVPLSPKDIAELMQAAPENLMRFADKLPEGAAEVLMMSEAFGLSFSKDVGAFVPSDASQLGAFVGSLSRMGVSFSKIDSSGYVSLSKGRYEFRVRVPRAILENMTSATSEFSRSVDAILSDYPGVTKKMIVNDPSVVLKYPNLKERIWSVVRKVGIPASGSSVLLLSGTAKAGFVGSATEIFAGSLLAGSIINFFGVTAIWALPVHGTYLAYRSGYWLSKYGKEVFRKSSHADTIPGLSKDQVDSIKSLGERIYETSGVTQHYLSVKLSKALQFIEKGEVQKGMDEILFLKKSRFLPSEVVKGQDGSDLKEVIAAGLKTMVKRPSVAGKAVTKLLFGIAKAPFTNPHTLPYAAAFIAGGVLVFTDGNGTAKRAGSTLKTVGAAFVDGAKDFGEGILEGLGIIGDDGEDDEDATPDTSVSEGIDDQGNTSSPPGVVPDGDGINADQDEAAEDGDDDVDANEVDESLSPAAAADKLSDLKVSYLRDHSVVHCADYVAIYEKYENDLRTWDAQKQEKYEKFYLKCKQIL